MNWNTEKEIAIRHEEEWLRKTGRAAPPAMKGLAELAGLTEEEYKEAMRKIGAVARGVASGPVPIVPTVPPLPITVKVDVLITKTNGGYKGLIVNWGGTVLDPKDWKDVTFKGLKPFAPGQTVEGVVKMVNGVMSLESAKLAALNYPSNEQKEKVEEMSAETTVTSSITDGFYISDEARAVFNTIWRMSRNSPEQPVKAMMVGGSGYGKTALPFLFSQVTGLDFYRMNCANIRDPEEWFGYREARGGETVFIPSTFIKLVEKGNAVIILDEFNRLEPWLHNTLYPLLDDDAKTVVHDQEFKVGPGTIFVGTINTGYKYTGTFELDEALFNRFPIVLEMGPLPHAEEVTVLVKRTGVDHKLAQAIVKLANILRQSEVGCSTRSTLLISQKIQAGMTLREAFEFAVVKRTPVDGKRKEVIDLINSNAGVYAPRKYPDDIFAKLSTTAPSITEPEAVKVPAFTFSKKEGSSFSVLAFQQLLKKLPLKETITASEASDLGELIEKGIPVIVQMSREFSSDDPLVEEIRKVGMTARYHKTYQQKRGVAE